MRDAGVGRVLLASLHQGIADILPTRLGFYENWLHAKGLRDGTIDLERMENVLYVGRPAFGQEQSMVGMFRLEPDDKTAVRAQVKLGRSSVNTVEILQGLKVGDQVILSDMSRWDNFDRVRLE